MSTSAARILPSVQSISEERGFILELRDRLNAVLRGKEEVIQFVIAGLLAQGHLLLEDRPGLGKTTLAKALADTVAGSFARVQCTPDLLPSDITGFSIFNQKTHEFEFRRGPIFSDVLLADEINRATPRTQSALLEAMAERQVTVDGLRYPLSRQFFVIATQNPHEQHGTYPLPEAQLDRFAMKISIGYPDSPHEKEMLADALRAASREQSTPEAPRWECGLLDQIQNQVARIAVVEGVRDYLVQLAAASRRHPEITLGISPRGLLTWQRVAQAWAYLDRRDYVTPNDVQDVASPVLSVRLGIDRESPPSVIENLLQSVEIPKLQIPTAG